MSVIERLLLGGCDQTRERLSDIVDGEARGAPGETDPSSGSVADTVVKRVRHEPRPA